MNNSLAKAPVCRWGEMGFAHDFHGRVAWRASVHRAGNRHKSLCPNYPPTVGFLKINTLQDWVETAIKYVIREFLHMQFKPRLIKVNYKDSAIDLNLPGWKNSLAQGYYTWQHNQVLKSFVLTILKADVLAKTESKGIQFVQEGQKYKGSWLLWRLEFGSVEDRNDEKCC